MANKDYDDLLESFMNNSAKVYNEDKKNLNKQKNIPTAYSSAAEKKDTPVKRGRVIEKEQANKRGKKKKPAKQKSTTGAKIGKAFAGIAMVIAVVCVVCFSVVAIYGYSVVHGDPVFNLTDEKMSQNQTSFIYGTDKDGNTKEITRLHGEENRIWVNLDEMSEYMPKAFIAIEDERFPKHHGVDWIRFVGVIVKPQNLSQGGSTITQQLIKNLTDENDVTFVRKFNEILSALNIERNYNKDEIIEAYLNTIYLSHGCYGVKTAAEKYFGKNVKDLNVAECACIAAITKAPTKNDPLKYPDNNKDRRDYILKKMLEWNYINQEQYEEALNYKLVFTNSEEYQGSQTSSSETGTNDNVIENYYVDCVIKTVIEDLQKMGYTEKKAKSLLYGGGLKVYTAIDFEVQESLEEIYENYKKMPDESVQGAMVVMNYEGRILGLIGGTGEYDGKLSFNRAIQAERQPGSSIKPLSIYGPAIEKSKTDDKCSIYWHTQIPDKPLKKVNGKWWPTNQGGTYSGNNVTLQYGLSKSMNTVAAQTLDMISVDYSFDFITENFHISTLDSVRDCDYAPMATGAVTTGVIPLEMTAAYAAFGNGGQYYYPYCYYKIEDSQGNIIIQTDAEATKEQALSEPSAWIMNKMLQTVMTSGTGTSYRLSSIECFGKTGTTTDDKDRWFIGGTPEYVAAVWYGYDNPKEIVYRLSANPSGTIWKSVMAEIYERKGINEKSFPKSDTIVQKSYGAGNGWYDVKNMPSKSTFFYHDTNALKTTNANGASTSTSAPNTSAPAQQTDE